MALCTGCSHSASRFRGSSTGSDYRDSRSCCQITRNCVGVPRFIVWGCHVLFTRSSSPGPGCARHSGRQSECRRKRAQAKSCVDAGIYQQEESLCFWDHQAAPQSGRTPSFPICDGCVSDFSSFLAVLALVCLFILITFLGLEYCLLGCDLHFPKD